MGIQIVDISAVTGLCAMIALTFNLLLGMLLSTAYKTSALWKKLPVLLKRVNIRSLHNYTAYLALALVLLHPALLLLDSNTKFTPTDILYPIHAPHQRLFATLGAVAMYALIIVIITTQKVVKKNMSFRTWKNIHLLSYGTALVFVIHGLAMDPELKDRTVDIFDGEKLLCIACMLALVAATAMRMHFYFKLKRIRQLKNRT